MTTDGEENSRLEVAHKKLSSSKSDINVQGNVASSSFRGFRRALDSIHSPEYQFGSFTVFTDTSSRLTNFRPHTARTHEKREAPVTVAPIQ